MAVFTMAILTTATPTTSKARPVEAARAQRLARAVAGGGGVRQLALLARGGLELEVSCQHSTVQYSIVLVQTVQCSIRLSIVRARLELDGERPAAREWLQRHHRRLHGTALRRRPQGLVLGVG